MMVISCLFIIFILLIFTIVIFYTRKNKTTLESFTTPTAINVPAANNLDGKPFFVGNRYPMRPNEPIVETSGKYEFKKMKLLYDGVWGEKCYLDGRGMEKCDWDEKNRECGKYGTDHFFHLPEKKLDMGEVVVSPPECRKSRCQKKKAKDFYYLEEPSFEDVFGFVPQSNRLEMDLPPPVVSTF